MASLATLTELAALPVMFFLRDDHPEVLPGVLMIADGAHLLILMWLHLDYTYFLAGLVKAVLGILFLFGGLARGLPSADGGECGGVRGVRPPGLA